MILKSQKLLTVIKITLEVLYTLCIIGYLWCVVSWVLASQDKLDQAEEWKVYTYNEALAIVIISVIGVIITIIGLIGIIKESKVLVIIMLIFLTMDILSCLIMTEWIEAIIEVLIASITILYIKLVVNKHWEAKNQCPNPS